MTPMIVKMATAMYLKAVAELPRETSFETLAAAALGALAEPDDAMIAAGRAVTDRHMDRAEAVFAAMIGVARGAEEDQPDV